MSSFSTGTFDLSYTNTQSRSFLDSVHANVLGGFTPNSNAADPNFGKCLQCAALDRARTKGNNTITRSAFCQTCFSQYCYDPNSPPSNSTLPNRKLNFVNPDPQGAAKIELFLRRNEGGFIGGLVGLLVFVGLLVGGLCVFFAQKYARIRVLTVSDRLWLRKRKQRRMAAYRRVASLHAGEEYEVADVPPWQQYTLSSSREAERFSNLPSSREDPFDK
jgi:lysophospholipase